MTDKNFQSDGDKFETLIEATDNAQKYAESRKGDVDIWQRVGVVRYPIPTFPVERITVA